MKRLAPYRGTLFRLAVTNALLVGVVAIAFIYLERAGEEHARVTELKRRQERERTDGATASAVALNEIDREFLRRASEVAAAEQRLADAAKNRATQPRVRELAQELAAEHTTLQNELSQLAGQRGVALPTGGASMPSAKRDPLAAAGSGAFDDEFVRLSIESLSVNIRMFERAADHSEDPQVRALAERMLPRLRQQLEQLRVASRTVQ